MNTATCEIHCSSPNSSSEDIKAEETRKDIKFSYTREFLLSLAEIDACKSLPSGFDSSILFDLKNASTSWFCSDSDSKRWDCNLSEDLPPAPECVAGVNARKLQGGYLPLQKSELNNASTCSSQSSNYSESGRWDGSISQHLHLNPECGLLGRGSILQEPGCLAGFSSPRVQGSRHHLLNRSVAPYRPPHLYKMKDATDGKTYGSSKCPSLERREDERTQRDSLEMMMEEHKPIKGKQQNVSDEHKENLDPDTQPEIPRNDKRILCKCYQTREVAVSSKSVEKIFQTKSLHHPSTQEHHDVEVDQTKNTMLSSSNFIDQFIKEEKKPAHGISMSSEDYEPEVSIEPNRSAYENESTSVSCPRCGSPQKLMAPTAKVSEQSCSFATSIICLGDLRSEETEHSNALEGSGSHLPMHQCMQSYDAQEQSNTASHSRSSQLLAMLKKGIDVLDLSEAPSNLDSHSTRTTENLRLDLTCGISMGNETNESEVYIEPNKNANNCRSKSFSSGINASEVCVSSTKISNEQESTDFSSHRIGLPQKDMALTSLSVTENVSKPLCSSSTSVMPPGVLVSKATGPSSASQVTEKHFSLDQCIEFRGIEKMHTNTTSHSGSSQQLLDFLKKEKDATDLEAAWSKLNCYNANITGNSDVGENRFSQHQCVEDHDVENMKSSTSSYSGSYQDLLYLLKKGGKDATYLAAAQSKLNSSGANITGNLDISENHFSQHQSVEYQDVENIQSSTSSHSRSSQNLLDLLKKGKDAADLAAAWSKVNSSDANISGNLDVSENRFSQRQFVDYPDIKNVQSSTVCHPGSSRRHLDLLKMGEDETNPAAACSKLNSSIARTTGKMERNLIFAMHEAGLRKEVQLIPSAVPTEYDFLWHSDFPSPLNSKINLLPMDELVKVNHETAASLSYGKQTHIDGIKGSDSVSSEVDNRMEFNSPSEQKLEPIPVSEFDEKPDANDEIRLPDEDSLITLNDLVYQMDSLMIAVGDSTDADLVARTTVTNAEKPAAFNVSLGDDKSPSSLGNATLASNAVADSETHHDKTDASQSYPRSHTYHRKPLFHHSEVWSSASKIYPYGPFNFSLKHSLPQQIVPPGIFPQQMVYYYPWLNQDFTQNYEQQIYGTPNPGHHKPNWRKL